MDEVLPLKPMLHQKTRPNDELRTTSRGVPVTVEVSRVHTRGRRGRSERVIYTEGVETVATKRIRLSFKEEL